MKKKKSALRIVLDVVKTTVVLAIIAFLIYVVVNNLRGNITFIGNKGVLWVKTDSMEPTIPAQSYIVVEKVNTKDLKVGDVISFISTDSAIGGALNTHRIVGTDNRGWYVTRGDNNFKDDERQVNPVAVRGRYVSNLPTLTKIGRFLSTPAGMAVLILVLLALTGAAFAPDILAAAKKAKNEERKAEIDALVQKEVERLKAEQDDSTGQPASDDKKDEAKPGEQTAQTPAEETDETEPDENTTPADKKEEE